MARLPTIKVVDKNSDIDSSLSFLNQKKSMIKMDDEKIDDYGTLDEFLSKATKEL